MLYLNLKLLNLCLYCSRRSASNLQYLNTWIGWKGTLLFLFIAVETDATSLKVQRSDILFDIYTYHHDLVIYHNIPCNYIYIIFTWITYQESASSPPAIAFLRNKKPWWLCCRFRLFQFSAGLRCEVRGCHGSVVQVVGRKEFSTWRPAWLIGLPLGLSIWWDWFGLRVNEGTISFWVRKIVGW